MSRAAVHVVPPPSAQERRPLRIAALLLVLLAAAVVRPVFGAFLVGGFAVIVAQGPFRRLLRALGGRRPLAAGLATATLLLVVFVPLSLAAVAGVQQAADLATWLRAGTFADKLPAALREALPEVLDGARTALLGSAATVAPLIPRIAASAGHAVVSLLLTVLTVFYLFLEGPQLLDFARRASPLQGAHTTALMGEVRAVAMGLFRGGVLVALYHGLSAGIGFALFGVHHVLLLGLLTAAAALVPLVGTALVSVPVIAGLYFAGHLGAAVGLAVWSLVVVGAGDHLFRPIWSQGEMAMPRLMLFLTIFGGLQVFGPIGLLLGPLIGSLAVVALRLIATPAAPA